MKNLITLCFLALLSSLATADGLLTEYRIPSSDLVTFSASGAVARLCANCEPVKVDSTGETTLFEMNQQIDLKRATELYVSPQYAYVSLHIYSVQGDLKLFALRFGPFIENGGRADNNSTEESLK